MLFGKMIDDSCDMSTNHFHAFEKFSRSPACPQRVIDFTVVKMCGWIKEHFFPFHESSSLMFLFILVPTFLFFSFLLSFYLP